MEKMNLCHNSKYFNMVDRTMARNAIDSFLDNKVIGTDRYEEGLGRKVFMFKDCVIKVPKNEGKLFCGDYQNETEKQVWFNTRHERLNEVYMEYRGCLVCKRIDTNPDVLLNMMGTDNVSTFEANLREQYGSELYKLIQAYKLQARDIFSISNWGYDYDTKEFKCIDYGMREAGAFTVC